jgi:DNA primase
VTLPEGLDPDDLVKKSGPRAFGALLDQAEPLVERIWKAELAAGPTVAPEDRAGLKQRLGTHLANIADTEIRRHYADAFAERFDQLFARKAPFQQVPSKRRGPWRPNNAPAPPSGEARAIGTRGTDLLMQGILTALLSEPALLLRHQEVLSHSMPRDVGHARLLSAMLDAVALNSGKETLDSAALLTILEPDLYNMAQALLQGGGTAFGFARKRADNGEMAGVGASAQLDEAIRLMKQRPELEAALQRATEAAGADLTEESFAEQQRLRAEKQAFDARLSALFQRDEMG